MENVEVSELFRMSTILDEEFAYIYLHSFGSSSL